VLVSTDTTNPYRIAGVPKIFHDKLPFVGDNKRLYLTCKNYRRRLRTNVKAGAGLVLMGDPGVGKSMLLAEIAKVGIDAGFRVKWIQAGILATFTGSMWDAKNNKDENRYNELKKMWNSYLVADLLFIDDYNEEQVQINKPRKIALEHTLKWRIDHGKSTFITSNHSKAEFKNKFGEKQFSWIHERNRIFVVTGDDMRKSRNIAKI
jgi:DNA replication protein DnaC